MLTIAIVLVVLLVVAFGFGLVKSNWLPFNVMIFIVLLLQLLGPVK